jgi:hypothetical protein
MWQVIFAFPQRFRVIKQNSDSPQMNFIGKVMLSLPDSLLSVVSCYFHKFLVVALTNTTVKNDAVTKKFHVKNKFGNTMELGYKPSLTLFVAVFVPSR